MARTIEDVPGSYGPLIEGIAKDCAANRKEIAAVDKRLDNTNVILSNLSYQVGGHQQHLAIISGDLAGVRDVVEATNLRTMKIEAEQGEANKRLARLETAHQKTNARLDGVEARLNEMKATQLRQGDKLADILDAVQRLNGKPAQN